MYVCSTKSESGKEWLFRCSVLLPPCVSSSARCVIGPKVIHFYVGVVFLESFLPLYSKCFLVNIYACMNECKYAMNELVLRMV